MNHKMIYKISGLIMTLVMVFGNAIHTKAALPNADLTVPSIYWGAMVNGKVPSNTNLQPGGAFYNFEAISQKKMSIIHWGQPWMMPDGSWGEFQTGYFDNVRNHGSIPMLNWGSQRLGAGINQADFQLRDIYNGTYDTYIARWATDAKNWGHPFFLYFDHEMNGWWTPWGEGKTDTGAIVNGNSPGDYVLAWRHVHDIFTAVGATNVSWVWAPNHTSTSSRYPALSTLYPGDAYVDWTGLSVYNKYNTWAGLNPLLTGSEGMTWFRNSYNDILALAPNKPIMLAQWASIEAGDGGAQKAAWITDALTVQIPTNFPKIKAVVWFDWQEVPSETYPIETSQAATAAWAAGIALGSYATNQFSNLDTSPIPALMPNVPANVAVNIGGTQQGSFTIQPHTSIWKNFTGINDGPVRIDSTNNVPGVASERYIYTENGVPVSYSEMMGYPGNRLTSEYYFPWYNNVNMWTQLRFANVGNQFTTVSVYLGTQLLGSYGLNPSESLRWDYPGVNGGPLRVVSSDWVPIIAAERILYSDKSGAATSYYELMGYPANQLAGEYWIPWYNNVNMWTQLRLANVGSQATTVSVYLGTTLLGSYSLKPSESQRADYPGVNGGPLRIVGSNNVPILAAERVIYSTNSNSTSYSELMAIPGTQLSSEYYFPSYSYPDSGTWSQLRVANPSASVATTVQVYLGGVLKGSYALGPASSLRLDYQGADSGPLRVVSSGNVPIIAAERVIQSVNGVQTSYSEITGLPASQLTTTYWFPWYNNANLNTQLRLAAP